MFFSFARINILWVLCHPFMTCFMNLEATVIYCKFCNTLTMRARLKKLQQKGFCVSLLRFIMPPWGVVLSKPSLSAPRQNKLHYLWLSNQRQTAPCWEYFVNYYQPPFWGKDNNRAFTRNMVILREQFTMKRVSGSGDKVAVNKEYTSPLKLRVELWRDL